MEVLPLKMGGCLLITFEEATSNVPTETREKKVQLPNGEVQGKRQVVQVQQEISSARDYLHSIIEEKEAGNEVLRAANEEMQQSNEELQATNERADEANEGKQ